MKTALSIIKSVVLARSPSAESLKWPYTLEDTEAFAEKHLSRLGEVTVGFNSIQLHFDSSMSSAEAMIVVNGNRDADPVEDDIDFDPDPGRDQHERQEQQKKLTRAMFGGYRDFELMCTVKCYAVAYRKILKLKVSATANPASVMSKLAKAIEDQKRLMEVHPVKAFGMTFNQVNEVSSQRIRFEATRGENKIMIERDSVKLAGHPKQEIAYWIMNESHSKFRGMLRRTVPASKKPSIALRIAEELKTVEEFAKSNASAEDKAVLFDSEVTARAPKLEDISSLSSMRLPLSDKVENGLKDIFCQDHALLESFFVEEQPHFTSDGWYFSINMMREISAGEDIVDAALDFKVSMHTSADRIAFSKHGAIEVGKEYSVGVKIRLIDYPNMQTRREEDYTITAQGKDVKSLEAFKVLASNFEVALRRFNNTLMRLR